MSLEHAFKQLAIRPSSLCRQCRRTYASSTRQPDQRGATAAFVGMLQPRPLHTDLETKVGTETLKQQSEQDKDSLRPFSTPDVAAPAPPKSDWIDVASASIRESTAGHREIENRRALAELSRRVSTGDLERQQPRRWNLGDVYAPHDISGVEASKWKPNRKQPKTKFDVLDRLRINPIHHYKNFSMMSEYMTEMGRIKHRNETGLRPVNQRRMAKAIRRAVGTGLLMPGTHRHPELLRLEKESSRHTAR
ncbi:ribosomal S18 [Lecanosticta acicola]|uniref:Small ribosomal subunit protein bS18m n=1 Tax=Lecanosticta acicola TaxID=111012 RepID=A0AAI9EAG8_9PEZI|nr:ribosomal S18 [Lecanosticta acicola]